MLIGLGLLASGCAGGTGAEPGAPAGDGCQYPARGQAAKPVDPPQTNGMPTTGSASIVLKTTAGDIAIALDRGKTPCTVNSFESLARQGYFDNTSCHRLTTEGILVLQCGDPTGTGSGGPGYSFADELTGSESYVKGVVAMANAGPRTNGSQFFLVYGDSTRLQPKYTLFGTMDQKSVDLVAKVAAAGTGDGTPDGPPKTPVTIRQVVSR
jgi:peptidyl-prolyl cis-trans isomerase B (cyclophilin B)